MQPKDITKSKDPDLANSMIALQRAALEARKIAIQTNTAIIIFKDGKIVRRTAEELKLEDSLKAN